MASEGQDVKEDQQNMSYILKHDMHHLFERLAGSVLQSKPKELIPFLISTLQEMDGGKPPADAAATATTTTAPAEPAPVPPQKEEASPTPAPTPAVEEQAKPDTAVPAEAAPAKEEKEVKETPYDPTLEDRRPIEGAKQALLKITIAVFGIGNAGKTTLLSALAGEVDTETTPTVGFTPIRMRTDKIDLQLYDLGGGKRIRSVWRNYYADLHGVIYVVDASADDDELKESAEEFAKVMEDERIAGKPVCIMANKQDISSRPITEIKATFLAGDIPHARVMEICALKPEHPAHSNIELGVEWILESISGRYEELAAKVKEQVAIEKEKNRKRMQEVRERVAREKEERERQEAEGAS
eukprot:TRINITY_DN29344_c0_g1_i1.p1 TRINITY_DN29344_c0_g1~~TRINITY_DN29344_c0_g1_i1.p1  ORF type:complete len:375 (+),score=145.64 TRINITY_DN29344_c0_g1_i1:62-1126(+)